MREVYRNRESAKLLLLASSNVSLPHRNRWERLAPLVIVAVALIHLPALGWWWLTEDPSLLLTALRVPAVDAFAGDPRTVNPLLLISLKLDLIVGALRPAVFYTHQIIALLIAGLLLDQLLRRYVDRWVSVAISAALLASWPAIVAARTLSSRHYVEGMVAAIAALIVWSARDANGIPQRSTRMLDAGGAVLWFLALVASPSFLPVALLIPLQKRANRESFRSWRGSLIWVFAALLVWGAWRWRVGGIVVPAGIERLTLLPWNTAVTLAGPSGVWGGWAFLVASIVVAVTAVIRAPRHIGGVATFVAAGVVSQLFAHERSAASGVLIVATLVAAGLALGLARSVSSRNGQRWVALTIAIIVLSSVPPGLRALSQEFESLQAEGRYLWNADSADPMLAGSADGAYLAAVRELRHVVRADAAPRAVYSDEAFITGGVSTEGYVRWSPESAGFEPLRDDVLAEARERERHTNSPWSIAVTREGEHLRWSFDGAPEAEWKIVFVPGFEGWRVPARGEALMRDREGFFYVVATRADGTWVSTPAIPIPLDGETAQWAVK